jgi:VWFA-related protein
VAIFLMSLSVCPGQTHSSDARASGPTSATKPVAQEISMDVVVRDKKGQRVTNLEPSDLLIYENGARCRITSLRPIEGGDSPRLITLIYSGLNLESRSIARKASLDLVQHELPRNVFLAVLVLDSGLRAIQAFTNDGKLLRKAIEHVISGTTAEFVTDSKRVEAELKQQTVGGGARAAMAQMMLNTLRSAQPGQRAVSELVNVVRQQYSVSGRKSILFIAPGFGVLAGVEDPWKTLISTANRFNVSFYTLDSRGLTTVNPNDQLVSELEDAASASRINRLSHGNNQVTPELAKAQDLDVENGNKSGRAMLAELAVSTGGFLIASTNDSRDDFRKLIEDVESHYEVTYNPEIGKFDGSFRKSEVRSIRPNLRIQARAGYFALPASAGKEGLISLSEVPLVQALQTDPLPREFEFQSAVMRFGNGDTRQCSVVLDVPLGNLTLTEPKPDNPIQGGLAYLMRVRDSSSNVVQSFRGEIPVSTDRRQAGTLREGHFVYHDFLVLSPGLYNLETAVGDKNGNRLSARRSVFVVPAAQRGLAMSSVSIVRAVRDKNEDTSAQDPFLVQGKLVTPDVSWQIKKASTGVSFYFVVYRGGDNAAKPKLTMTFMRDGESVLSGSSDLGAFDENGRIQYIATAKTESMGPGNYQVRLVVSQGSESIQEFVSFSLE